MAGALNSVAGGGSFISFPALLLVGTSPIVANATNAVALWPAGVASAVAYRKDLDVPRAVLAMLGAASLAGGLVGAIALLKTPDATFVRQIPWLLLAATSLFSAGPWLTKLIPSAGSSGRALAGASFAQLVIGLYGGYFGGGMGIMMLAAMSLLAMKNIHAMNGLKAILGVLINGIAVVAFIVGGAVAWRPGVVMICGAMVGGYAGARVARGLDPRWVRRFVGVVAWGLTAYFFVRAYE